MGLFYQVGSEQVFMRLLASKLKVTGVQDQDQDPAVAEYHVLFGLHHSYSILFTYLAPVGGLVSIHCLFLPDA